MLKRIGTIFTSSRLFFGLVRDDVEVVLTNFIGDAVERVLTVQVDMMVTGLLQALWPVLPPSAQKRTV